MSARFLSTIFIEFFQNKFFAIFSNSIFYQIFFVSRFSILIGQHQFYFTGKTSYESLKIVMTKIVLDFQEWNEIFFRKWNVKKIMFGFFNICVGCFADGVFGKVVRTVKIYNFAEDTNHSRKIKTILVIIIFNGSYCLYTFYDASLANVLNKFFKLEAMIKNQKFNTMSFTHS